MVEEVVEEEHSHEFKEDEVAQAEEPDFGDGPAADIRRAFWERSAQFLDYLHRSQSELSEENVHELRVGCRRLGAVLELVGELIGARPIRKLSKQLKQIRRACGELRELQVHLDMLQSDPLLQGFHEAHGAHLPKLLKGVSKTLNKFSAGKLEKKLELLDSLVSALIEGAEPGSHDHLAMLSHPFIETRAYAEYATQHMDLETTATVHAVRLALKKMRYQAEFLEEVGVIQGTPGVWEAVRAFHKAAGSLQDLETLTRIIDVHWVNFPPARDVQLKVLGRLWKERQPHLAGLDHNIALEEFEIREDLRVTEELEEQADHE